MQSVAKMLMQEVPSLAGVLQHKGEPLPSSHPQVFLSWFCAQIKAQIKRLLAECAIL